MPDIRTVLFDLDGTLADTAPDLAHALNTVLKEQGRDRLPYDLIRPEASHGGIALIRLGFGLAPGDQGFDPLRQRLLQVYAENLCRETRLFAGIPQLLEALGEKGLNWGVVTNKPAYLTEPLVERLGIARQAACIVRITGCDQEQRTPWDIPDQWHWRCDRVRPIRPGIPMKGRQGLFKAEYPESILALPEV